MRVPATGVCDKKLSLLNTSVVVVRVRFCKYPHLAHFAPIVCKCDTARINSQCYFVYKVERCCCVPMTRLYLTSRQVTCVDIQYHAEHPLVKYTSRGNSITMTRQTFSKSYRFANICQTNQSWYSMTNIGVVPCTVHMYWHIYQIHESWERGVRTM